MNGKKVKIGVPRALLYHKYRVFWQTFFKELKCDLIVSPETNRAILSRGLNLAIDESCLSVKIFLGHVDWLRDRVDYIFIPHIISPHRKEQTCVKIMALYDIVKNTFDDINLLEYTLDADSFKFSFFAYMKVGFCITKNPILILKAYFNKKIKLHYIDKVVANYDMNGLSNNYQKLLKEKYLVTKEHFSFIEYYILIIFENLRKIKLRMIGK
jgi:predicted nucleotide-binding protein (sugar kinase/HSP70/actin superfamily)